MTYSILIPFAPASKKNSQRIVRNGGIPRIIPSAAYKEYELAALPLVREQWTGEPLSAPCNVAMMFYMPTRRRVDLVNLQEAALDVLVKAGVLADDCSAIVETMDGSGVRHDKEEPRTEITITEKEARDEEGHNEGQP